MFSDIGAFKKPIENLGQVFEIPKIGKCLSIESQGFTVGFVEPKSRGVEPFFIELLSASHTPQIAYQLQSGHGVVGPGQLELLDQILLRGIGHYLEEEVQARVSGRQKRWREVFRQTHRGFVVIGSIAICIIVIIVIKWFSGEMEIVDSKDNRANTGVLCKRKVSGGRWT